MSVQRGAAGFELGAASVNAVLTFGLLIAGCGAALVVSYPAVHVGTLLVVAGVGAVVLPVLFYPFSYTIWFAVELRVDPPSSAEVGAAASRRSTLDQSRK